MQNPILSLQHVYVSRGGAPVLHDINLTLHAGEHLAILGPNGCGKSTLLKTLTCELYPLAHAPDGQQTSVSIFGRQRWDLTALRQRLGVVSPELPGKPTLRTSGFDAILTGFFSASTLWPNLSVTDAMRARAEDLLRQVGAEGLRHKPVGEMSAGEQRRIMIARALAGSRVAAELQTLPKPGAPSSRAERERVGSEPPQMPGAPFMTVPPSWVGSEPPQTPENTIEPTEPGAPSSRAERERVGSELPQMPGAPFMTVPPSWVGSEPPQRPEDTTQPTEMLLLDEPSNALDLAAQQDLRSLLRQLARAGAAILLITHHTADIIPEIGRVLLMQNGRIVADGPKRDLLTAPALSGLFRTEVQLTESEGFFHAR